MMMPFIVTLVCGVALLRGGSLRHFNNLRLRFIPLVVGGFVLQLLIFTPLRKVPLITFATPQLYILSMALVVGWVALNWRIPGMPLMAAGLLMNFAAIVANGGYMPVAPVNARYAGKIANYAAEGMPIANNSIATDDHVHLWLLTDILAVPQGVPLANVFSLGDVLLTAGVGVLCYRTIRYPPEGTPVPEGDPAERSACPDVGAASAATAPMLVRRLKTQLQAVDHLLEQDREVAERMVAQIANMRRGCGAGEVNEHGLRLVGEAQFGDQIPAAEAERSIATGSERAVGAVSEMRSTDHDPDTQH